MARPRRRNWCMRLRPLKRKGRRRKRSFAGKVTPFAGEFDSVDGVACRKGRRRKRIVSPAKVTPFAASCATEVGVACRKGPQALSANKLSELCCRLRMRRSCWLRRARSPAVCSAVHLLHCSSTARFSLRATATLTRAQSATAARKLSYSAPDVRAAVRCATDRIRGLRRRSRARVNCMRAGRAGSGTTGVRSGAG